MTPTDAEPSQNQPPTPQRVLPDFASCPSGEGWWAELRAVFEEVLDQKLGEVGLGAGGGLESERRHQEQEHRARLRSACTKLLPEARTVTGGFPNGGNGSGVAAWGEEEISRKASKLSVATNSFNAYAEPSTGDFTSEQEEDDVCTMQLPTGLPVGAIARVGQSSGHAGDPISPAESLKSTYSAPHQPLPPDTFAELVPRGTRQMPDAIEPVRAWDHDYTRRKSKSEASLSTRSSTLALPAGLVLNRVARASRRDLGSINSINSQSSHDLGLRLHDPDNCCVRARKRMRLVVKSQYFDWALCSIIVLNAISLGVQTDYVAATQSVTVPQALRTVEQLFCAVFVLELCMRIFVYRLKFFFRRGWFWNVFDCVIVGLQLCEEVLGALSREDTVVPTNMSFARVLRILRLIRVIRLVRILRLIRELRMLVSSISNSLKSLGWTVLLLVLMIYTVALYITQLVTDHLISSNSGEYSDDLQRHFGRVGLTMLSLFQSITGGLDWDTLVHPLIEEISPWSAILFTIFIAFAVLAMMNVVTGVFVESVLLSAKADKDIYLINSAREIFRTVDGGMSCGTMTWAQFQDKLNTPQMQDFFKGIDVDPSEAKGLFRLLDLDGSGTINANEFLSGCIRLRGPAKALDTAVLIEEVKSVGRRMKQCAEAMQQAMQTAPLK